MLDVNEKLSTDIAAKALEVVDAQKNFARCVQDNKKLKSEKELLRKCGLDYKLKRDKMQESLDKITADVADERKQYQQNDQVFTVKFKAEFRQTMCQKLKFWSNLEILIIEFMLKNRFTKL